MSALYGLGVAGTLGGTLLLARSLTNKKQPEQKNNSDGINWVSDVTKMDARPMDKIFYVKNVEDINHVIQLAKQNSKKISIAGQRHTMGGHTITENGYLIDMKYMNRILNFDHEKRQVTVEPGILWSDLIKFLNQYGLSPMTLQSYASFSIGGTVSVNGHGITNDLSMVESIVGIKLINHNGDIIYCSREENAELFAMVVGGYGLFGVMIEITLMVVPNRSLKMKYAELSTDTFITEYMKAANDPKVDVKLGRINITNFEKISLYVFESVAENIVSTLDNNPNQMSKGSQLMYKWLMPLRFGQKIRYGLESLVKKPLDWSSDCERNKLLYETATPMGNLYNPLISLDRTHVLQEYFIPVKSFPQWMTQLKQFLHNRKFKKITLLNITIRYVKKDDTTFLRYSKENVIAAVFYYRSERHEEADRELRTANNGLTDITLNLNGTIYLPYRHHYSVDQLLKAYPEIVKFFAAKLVYDPAKIFTNMWYEHYSRLVPGAVVDMPILVSHINANNLLLQIVTGNPSNDSRNSYTTIFSSPILTYKFREFLKNIFYLIPPEELFGVVDGIMKKDINTTDLQLFQGVQKYLSSKNIFQKIKSKRRTLGLLSDQRKDFVGQMLEIFRSIGLTRLNGYASIGDAGRNIKMLKNNFPVTGNIYIVHDKQSMMDMVERQQIRSVGRTIHIDYNNEAKVNINDKIDLVTCMMGLHHFPINKLSGLITSVHNTLNPGGLFIIREHNAYPELVPILNAAHNIFNAVTGETLDNEKNEIRQFRTINEWTRLIESYGFEQVGCYGMQSNDTTEDLMVCFRRMETPVERAVTETRKYIVDTREKYVRGLDQTYSTLTEWYLVDIAQKFGKFLERTPYYNFPFLYSIALFWKLWYREAKVINAKCGFRKAYLSEYTIASIVMGTTVTCIFSLMSALSFVPRLIYGSGANMDATHVSMMVIHDNLDLTTIHRDINILNAKACGNKTLSLIKVPRYLKFTQVAIALAKAHVQFYEICGQKEIQVKIAAPKSDDVLQEINKLPGCKVLFKYNILKTDSFDEVALSVEIAELSSVIRDVLTKRLKILHIYDF